MAMATGIGSLFEQANTGNTEAMRGLAQCYRRGEGVTKNLAEALHWYRAARDGVGVSSVGSDYHIGGDVDKAVPAWAVAADLGHTPAMCMLGRCYQRGVGVECDQQRAVSLYSAAIAKSPRHSWRLGVCYLRGEGVPRNWATAVRLLTEPTVEHAQAFVGWCYLWGCGVTRDAAMAVRLLRSFRGSNATVFLGYCHERGVGVVLDTEKARELFNNAKSNAPWGAEALGELGEYCQRGDCGAPTDKRAAVGYFQMGAEGGDPVSMFHLGVCLRDGDGIDCNVEQSQHWLVMAAKLGHRGAAKLLSESSALSNGWNNSVVPQQEDNTVETLKKRVEALEELLLQEMAHSAEKFDSLKKEVAKLEKENEHLRKELQEEVVKSTRYITILNTMTSLISATVGDFVVEKLLGTGSNAAVFKVQFQTTTSNNPSSLSISTTTPTSTSGASGSVSPTTGMVMKIIFNWENTPQQTLLRRKYMAECVVLSLVPNHPNVIHPLGALVIPCLPAEFVEKIPSDKKYFREELCNNKSLAILMPHCGITLSSFLLSSTSSTIEVKNLFVQGLKAISHIESHFVVHRDIKGDNILVDPETGKLTLIDFGEAQHCPNMDMMVSATSQPWGNTGTMPPELSMFLKRITRGTSGVFSYSKCDSFALALTFWDALLPQSNRFIGSTMNGDMSTFNTQKLLSQFPLHSFSSVKPSQPQVLFSSAASTTPPQPLPTQTTTVASGEEVNQNYNGGVDNTVVPLVESVMIRMMNPDKAARLSAADAISALTHQSPSTNKL
ncbi:calmodulin-dependent protein kinase [Pelomyxa schiedti]|nr:calmodulin-dependent protein kinase [Pelomyxa schiedti]